MMWTKALIFAGVVKQKKNHSIITSKKNCYFRTCKPKPFGFDVYRPIVALVYRDFAIGILTAHFTIFF